MGEVRFEIVTRPAVDTPCLRPVKVLREENELCRSAFAKNVTSGSLCFRMFDSAGNYNEPGRDEQRGRLGRGEDSQAV